MIRVKQSRETTVEQNAIISKLNSEYDRLMASIKCEEKDDIDFFDHCEESTSTMLVELNGILKNFPPTDEFRELFKKIYDLNTLAVQKIDSCEQRQRDAK